eukprot:TRINITY_DN44077_c0_g1_i1.p1 TRINITY_DN44077_c0_g1~~TRINITY_DN44077_c0_g1_i1.p1  ORF type:complete len:989 (-),score=127.50 TRINITY_DN44077_c0_g1_i1:171-3002(-)
MDDSQGGDGPPLLNDNSYQGPPVEEFDDSRAVGVAAFKVGLGLGHGLSSLPGVDGGSDASNQGNLWEVWADAAKTSGQTPVDFGFLLGTKPSEEAGTDSVSSKGTAGENDAADAASPTKKRGRMDIDGCDFLVPSTCETDASRGSHRNLEPLSPANHAKPSHFCGGAADGSLPVKSFDGLGAGTDPRAKPIPPRPARRPSQVLCGVVPGEDRGPRAMDPPVTRTDVFAWMRDDTHESEEVMELLREENHYAEAMQSHLSELREVLYNEMRQHEREAESSLLSPCPGGYGYFHRTFVGKSYGALYRCKILADGAWGAEELVLDENELVETQCLRSKRPYLSVTSPQYDHVHQSYACGIDYCGTDSYTLRVFRPSLQSNTSTFGAGVVKPTSRAVWSSLEIKSTDGSAVWGLASECIYYVRQDHEFRSYQARCHRVGDDPTGVADASLFEEADKRFCVSVCTTTCGSLLIVSSDSSETSEIRLLDLGDTAAGLRRIVPRQFAHRYSVDRRGLWLYALTNKDGAKNSKLCRFPIALLPDVALDLWEDVWVPSGGTKLDSLKCFQDFIALEGREQGECRIFVSGYADEPGSAPLHAIAFPDASMHSGHVLTPRGATAARAAFSAGLSENAMFQTKVLRYNYSSFTVPTLTYEYTVQTQEHKLLRRADVPKFDAELYRAERIMSQHRGVPISLVYRKDIHQHGLAGGPFPVLLTGYGAYGCCQDPDFDGNRLSLLDRGVIYAIAHVRGGGEFGWTWYEEGRYKAVKNRFADFVDAAETLVALRITAPATLAAWGTSSGGLLVTASANLRPDLFRAILLEVPFVDAVSTMADPSVPLTVGDWEEVGNPNELEYYYYILEYSPYDNIRMDAYPAVLATSSLNDSMVGYWEPLKYVSKLRLLKTDERPVLLKTDFHAGHAATSDRYESTRQLAFFFSFLLDELGLAGTSSK